MENHRFNKKKILSLVLVPLVSLLIALSFKIDLMSSPVTYKEKYDNCRYLNETTPGPEDITKYNSTVLVFGAGDLMQLMAVGEPSKAVPGQIYAIYNADKENFYVHKMIIRKFPINIAFQPHGMYITKIQGSKYLYVINHAYNRGGERIECFKIVEGNEGFLELLYDNSVVFPDDKIGILNDLVVLSNRDILVTQYLYLPDDKQGHKYTSIVTKIINLLQRMSNLKWTNVYHCKVNVGEGHISQSDCNVVEGAEGVSNNGITYDGEYVYVADSVLKNLRRFRVEKNNTLVKVGVIELPGTPDNVEFDPDTNKLYIGVIPKVSDYLYYKYLGEKSGGIIDKNIKIGYWSAAYEVQLTKGGNNNPPQLMHQEQDIDRGTSTTYQIGSNLFLGSWGEQHLVVCRSVKT